MTQHELVKKYCELHGSILPAKMAGSIFMGVMFGSETSKRCRELRKKGTLISEKDGKFERFKLNVNNKNTEERTEQINPPDTGTERQSVSTVRQTALPGFAYIS